MKVHAEQTVNILERLRLGPDVTHFFMDDHEVKGLILDLHNTSFIELDHGPKKTRTHVHCDHPTHWILLLRFSGYPEEKDNGYGAFCVPKSDMTFQQFQFVCADMFNARPGNEGCYVEKVEPYGEPKAN